jgi:hypothetical protein
MSRYLLAWLPMVAIAVGNGALREAWLVQRLGEMQARQVSTLLLLLLFTAYFYLLFRKWPVASGRQALAIGFAWLALTLAFELALGRLVSGLAWSEILAEYDVGSGRLWVLVPLWVAVGPYVLKKASADRSDAR